MTLYAVKPAFQRLLRPLVGRLARAGVTANAVTLAAAGLSVALGVVLALTLARWAFALLPALLLLRMALNAVDGMLAREYNQQSRLGAYLNELADTVSDAALYLPFALLPGGWPAAVLVALALTGELAGVLGQTQGAGRRYDGPLGKSDRALLFGVLALLLAGGLAPGLWLTVTLLLACALCLLGVVNRVRAGLRGGRA